MTYIKSDCGIYLQGGDLFVSADKHGLNLITQWDEKSIDAKYVKDLTLDVVESAETKSSNSFRVRLNHAESAILLSVEGKNLDTYRLTFEDAKLLTEYINNIAKKMWL